MGYATHRFVSPVDENLVCSVCSGVFDNPSLTACGHTFCRDCLNRWFTRSLTCPTCRAGVSGGGPASPIPILTLRSLISSLLLTCEFAERGCSSVVRLDQLVGHTAECDYAPIECAGCQIQVNRVELGSHQLGCFCIQAELNDSGGLPSQKVHRAVQVGRWSCLATSSPISIDLIGQLASLRVKFSRAQKTSEASESRTRILEKELKRSRLEVKEILRRLNEAGIDSELYDPRRSGPINCNFEDFGYVVSSVKKLTQLLNHRFPNLASSTLLKLSSTVVDSTIPSTGTPDAIEAFLADQIFSAVKRCYDYHRRGSASNDVLTLLATAQGNVRFSIQQRRSMRSWLRSMLGEDTHY